VSNTYQKDRRRAQPDRQPGEVAVPEQVIVSMAGIAESAKEGLLALAVGTGLQVMTAMFTEDAQRLCGPEGKHNPDRDGYRHGSEAGSVTLGGRRVPGTRPRVRATDGSGELHLPSYDLFSSTEILGPAGAGEDAGGPVVTPLHRWAGARWPHGGRAGGGHQQVGGVTPVRGRDRDCPGAADDPAAR
jgi:hypothetical protein